MSLFNSRRTERYDLELSAQLSVQDPSEYDPSDPSAPVIAQTVDVSASGALFRTDANVPVGTPVKIELFLPLDELKKLAGKKARIKVSGAVIRSDHSGVAVCFDENYEILPVS